MNKLLYNKEYNIPDNIIKYIQNNVSKYSNNKGIKRANNLIKNKKISYQLLKKMKNYYDYIDYGNFDKIEYELNGGDLMRDFVYNTLKTQRNKTNIYKKNTEDLRVNNIGESVVDYKHYAICILFNKDKKVLLLKRSSYKDQWEPNKWCLPGGTIENNETPELAVKRELLEETGISNVNIIKEFKIVRNANQIEHIFICVYDGELFDIELNFEHSGYGWFSKSEIEFLDTVPNLNEYIIIGITNY